MVSKMRMEVRIPCAVSVPSGQPHIPEASVNGWIGYLRLHGVGRDEMAGILTGMDALAQLLRERGVDVVFLAPGEEE